MHNNTDVKLSNQSGSTTNPTITDEYKNNTIVTVSNESSTTTNPTEDDSQPTTSKPSSGGSGGWGSSLGSASGSSSSTEDTTKSAITETITGTDTTTQEEAKDPSKTLKFEFKIFDLEKEKELYYAQIFEKIFRSSRRYLFSLGWKCYSILPWPRLLWWCIWNWISVWTEQDTSRLEIIRVLANMVEDISKFNYDGIFNDVSVDLLGSDSIAWAIAF